MQVKALSSTQVVSGQEACKIVGRGTLSGNGLPFVLVSSSSEPGRVHCVAYAYEGAYVGARIHCDCVAASYGRSCNHVRLVLVWLAELMASAPLSGSTSAPIEPVVMLEPDARETMVNRTRPFSLMKT